MRWSSLAVLLCFLTVPGPAFAQGLEGNAPPGNSAVDQYVETIPTATGNRRSSGGDRPARARLPGSTASALGRQSLGQELVYFAEVTGVPRVRNDREESSPTSRSEEAVQLGRPEEGKGGGKAITALERSLVGSDGAGGGMGIALPIILGAIALAGMVAALRRPAVR